MTTLLARLLGALLFALPLASPAQSIAVSASCSTGVFLSADIPGLIGSWPCPPLAQVDSPGSFSTSAAGGSARLGGKAQATVRGGYGNLGVGVDWSAQAVQGAAAGTFSVVANALARSTDVLNVGGQVGGGLIPIDVQVTVAWDSGLSGNDSRQRSAWMLESVFRLSFGSAADAAGQLPADPLELAGCDATPNVFALLGPAFALTCTQRGYGPHLEVFSGTYFALPQSSNLLEYSLEASGSFGGLHGTVLASDPALSAAGYLSSLNSMTVSIGTRVPGVTLAFASGADYLAPVPEPTVAALWLMGLLLLALLRWPFRRCAMSAPSPRPGRRQRSPEADSPAQDSGPTGAKPAGWSCSSASTTACAVLGLLK